VRELFKFSSTKCPEITKAPIDIGSVNPTKRSATANKKESSLESVAILPKHEYGENISNDDDYGLDYGSN